MFEFKYFNIDGVISYQPFQDDFGPMCLGSVSRFCSVVDEQLKRYPGIRIAMVTQPDKRTLTNTIFLLGSYMIMRLGLTPEQVESRLEAFVGQITTYRDISPGKQNFHLHVRDCWAGIWRAKSLSWVDFAPGHFDVDEYEHFASALNGSMTEIVPGKFIVMRGPKSIPGNKNWRDIRDLNGQLISRDFSPAHYAEILQNRNVEVVIRLNAPEYEDKAFADHGIAVADLRFSICGLPPADVVGKFLAIAEGVSGPVAVHCRAGLGRTGTMIGLYMMKHYGFSAREAMGWLRIVRPGRFIILLHP
jgi:cell division cycle 14